jgi:hypothetical protein
MDGASHGPPGTDLVPLDGGHGVAGSLTTALDVALGAGSTATGAAARLGGAGREVVRAGARVAGALPGANLAAGLLSAATRPLADDGARVRRQVRERAVAEAQRALEALVPAIVDVLDVDALVRRVDVDALLRRVDLEALLARVDLDALLARVDVDAIADRIDVNAIVQRVDVDAVIEETEIGTIVARSTSGFAAEALDAARTQTVSADTLVTRLVDRLLRRRDEGPLGPPLLVRDEPGEASPGEDDMP